jgi:hypothetical protein
MTTTTTQTTTSGIAPVVWTRTHSLELQARSAK